MALSLFADAMLHGRPIKVFNHGDMLRDFTYVDDIVNGIFRVAEARERLPKFDIFNIGNHRSERLLDVIDTLAAALGVEPRLQMLPMQPGDVLATYASIDIKNFSILSVIFSLLLRLKKLITHYSMRLNLWKMMS